MKKERNLLIIFFSLAIFYLISLVFFEVLRKDWLSLNLLLIAAYLFVKTYFFRSDSSLFLAFLSLFASIILNTNIVWNFSTFQAGSLVSVAVCASFLLDWIIFHNSFCFWTFYTNFFTNLPIFLYAFNCINLTLMVLFLCGAVGLILSTLLIKKYG